MNVTPSQRSITEYHLTLSAEEAALAVSESWKLGELIAEQLRAAGVGPVSSNGEWPAMKG